MTRKSHVDILFKRGATFRCSSGQFNDLGRNAEQKINALLSGFTILDWLSAISKIAKNRKLELRGFQIDKDNQITISLNSLAVIASHALSIYAANPTPIKWQNSLETKEIIKKLLFCALCYNDETNMGDPVSRNEETVVSNVLVPTKYNQAKFRVPPKFQLCRIYSWYCDIEASAPLDVPSDLDAFVQEEYGVTLSNLGHCVLFLWAVGELRNPFIWSQVFCNISNWTGSSAQIFLDKFAHDINKYSSPWTLRPESPDIQSGIPMLYSHPVIHIGKIGDDDIYCVPVRKLLLIHMEDTFYWKCFDYFKNKEKGKAANTFTNWFGKVFEEYCIKLLRGIAENKFLKDLRYLEKESKPSLDAAEILPNSATFFEFKNRRLLRKHNISWTASSEHELKQRAMPIISQVVDFAETLKNRTELWNPNIRQVRFVIVTPYHWNINVFICHSGWFHDEMCKVKIILGLQKIPELLFLNILDLEGWGKGNGTKGIILNNYLNEYMQSNEYPYLDFFDWITQKYPTLGSNPVIDEAVEALYRQIKSKYSFK